MKSYFFAAAAALSLLPMVPSSTRAQIGGFSFVYETSYEFFGSGDFDGDGRQDIVIADKESGKYRLGYQTTPGAFSWVDCRPSGAKGFTGFSVGALLVKNHDALAFTSPDGSQITFVDASSVAAPGKPVSVPFTAALGPNSVIAVDAGTAGKTGLLDLYVGSIYNSPDANLADLLQNDGAQYPKIAEVALPGPVTHGNRLLLKESDPESTCFLLTEEKLNGWIPASRCLSLAWLACLQDRNTLRAVFVDRLCASFFFINPAIAV
jgi:hypothetical protein